MYQSAKEKMKRFAAPAMALAVTVSPFMAHADEVTDGMTSLQTQIITYVTLGITSCIAILLVSLAGDIGIGVAKKWLKKGAN
jgi:hypothetical protein